MIQPLSDVYLLGLLFWSSRVYANKIHDIKLLYFLGEGKGGEETNILLSANYVSTVYVKYIIYYLVITKENFISSRGIFTFLWELLSSNNNDDSDNIYYNTINI